MTTQNTNPKSTKTVDATVNNPFIAPFQKMMEDHQARMDAAFAEFPKQEAKGMERITQGIDEMANLWKGQLNYFSQLQSEWRKMAVEATEKAQDYVKGAN